MFIYVYFSCVLPFYLIGCYRFCSVVVVPSPSLCRFPSSFNRSFFGYELCAVHFYDMLHSFGKAKHIFILESIDFYPYSVFATLFNSIFFLLSLFVSCILVLFCFSRCHCRSVFHFFAVHFVATSMSSLPFPFLILMYLRSCVFGERDGVICCLCHRQHFILPH